MSQSLDSLFLLISSILSTQPWLRDPKVLPMPWRQEVTDATLARTTSNGYRTGKESLKFGVLWNDGVVTPHPPIQRGLHLVVKAIKNAGHNVIITI